MASASLNSEDVQKSKIKNPKAYSCVRCFERKVKCTKEYPCSACRKSSVECVFRAPAPPKRRKKKSTEDVLLGRLQRYEALLKDRGVNLDDAKDEDVEMETGSTHDSIREFSPHEVHVEYFDIGDSRKPRQGRLIQEKGKSRYLENNLWSTISDELHQKDTVFDEATEDEANEIQIQDMPHSEDPDGVAFLLDNRPSNMNLLALHPSPAHIFKLWQIFLDNVDPLCRIIHRPTLQTAVLEASFNLEKISKGLETMLFAIYASAVNSLTETECVKIFQSQRANLLATYLDGTRKALVRAKFLASSELVVLQAFVIYLLSMRQNYDARTVYALTGVASRIAQSLGLHLDGDNHGITPFDAEMRRRLWWQIVLLDGRSAELSGSGRFSVSHLFLTKVPGNYNDEDLQPDMKSLPPEVIGATDMIGVKVRYETGEFLRRTNGIKSQESDGSWMSFKTAGNTLEEKDKAIDEYEMLLRDKYLRYCDPSVPIHNNVSIVMTVVIATLRLTTHRHDNTLKDTPSAAQSAKDRRIMFTSALKAVECDNVAHSSRSTQRFLWHVRNYFQWHAMIYLLSDLRTREPGEDVDKAWEQIEQVYENHPEFITNKRPLHIALGSLCLKAYNACEAAKWRQSRETLFPEPPEFIVKLRAQAVAGKPREQNSATTTTTGTDTTDRSTASSEMLPQSQQPEQQQQQQQQHQQAFQAPAMGVGDVDYFSGMDMRLPNVMNDPSPLNWEDWDYLLQDFDFPFDPDSLQK